MHPADKKARSKSLASNKRDTTRVIILEETFENNFPFYFAVSLVAFVITALFFFPSSRGLLSILVIVATLAFFLWLLFTSKKLDMTNFIELSPRRILVNNKGERNTYEIEKIKEIKFKYVGIEGRFGIITGSFDSGGGNELDFITHDNEKVGLKFFLKGYQVSIIDHCLNSWQKKGVKINTSSMIL